MINGDAVIIDAVRTPIGRRNGSLAQWHPSDLLGFTLKGLLDRVGLDPASVDDVVVGCVSQVNEQACNIGRGAWLAAGLPESVPATTVERQCGSSQQAVHFAAQAVLSGACDVVIAAGVESMTRVPMGSTYMHGSSPFTPSLVGRYDGPVFDQGLAAELIALDYGLERDDLDDFGCRSHLRAASAIAAGRFDGQILPVPVDSGGQKRFLTTDEGVRPTPDRERMRALEPVFKSTDAAARFPELQWVVTAGNASQISDGAAAVLIASRAAASRLGLTPRARIVDVAVVGSDPVRMLTGPIPATTRVLQRAGLSLTSDVDLVEINEAFASVVLAWKKGLGIDDDWFDDHVNVSGGAIALGHPLGASGARLVTTLVSDLEHRGAQMGLVTMCEGFGMANATLIGLE